jgi:hypothetical protein
LPSLNQTRAIEIYGWGRGRVLGFLVLSFFSFFLSLPNYLFPSGGRKDSIDSRIEDGKSDIMKIQSEREIIR